MAEKIACVVALVIIVKIAYDISELINMKDDEDEEDADYIETHENKDSDWL
jgi:microcompartment protein CcmL/EutN